MKKSLVIFCIVTVCLLLFSIFASAHSGKTDSNGGHRDHSTGEYHYHHGYPEHQHYDINGDGIEDCPYEYKDKTNTSSHNSGSSYNDISDISVWNILEIILYLIPITLASLWTSYLICVVLYIVLLLFFEGILNRSLDEKKTKKALLSVGIVLTIIGDVAAVIWLIMII